MKTLKVRIAVAVNPKTMEWNSAGWKLSGDVSDEDKMEFAVEPLPEVEQRFWIEAELPIVEPDVIIGKVSNAE
jgi:hypothetical protein